MSVRIKKKREQGKRKKESKEYTQENNHVYSDNYSGYMKKLDFQLEMKQNSNKYKYSYPIEDTNWKSSRSDFISLKHYRRDLDALS